MAPRKSAPKSAEGPRKDSTNAAGSGAARLPRKLIEFDPSMLQAIELLARDSMKDVQELADEAFRDLLKKHGRPSDLKDALRRSARQLPANDERPASSARKRR
jgi:hypothetical protein